MKTQLEIQEELKAVVLAEARKPDWYGMTGASIIHPCSFKAITEFVTSLYEEIETLKNQAGLKVN
jgi:hypothetical protein